MNTWNKHIETLDINGEVAIGLSGGADSMALVKLMKDIEHLEIIAITVDHGLREESAQESAQVKAWMSNWGLEHTTLTWQTPSSNRIQEKARQARYHLISQWCYEHHVPTLLTAHHLDDAIETFWMRAFRGSGITGLCSIKKERPLMWNQQPFGRIIRPSLHLRRDELREALEGHPYIDDPSNENENFERVRIRNWLKDNPDKNDGAIRSMRALQETEDYIENQANTIWEELALFKDGTCVLKKGWRDVPPLLRKRLWQKAVQQVGHTLYPMSFDVCNNMDDALMNHKAFTAGGVIAKTSDGLAVFKKENR